MDLLIAYILGLLTAIQKPSKKSEGGVSPTTKPEQENDGRNVLSSSHPQVVPTPQTTRQSCECCHHKTPRWKVVLDWLTFLAAVGAVAAAIWYACITRKMWSEVRSQSRTAQQQLELSQRPWIKITDIRTSGDSPIFGALSFQAVGPYPSMPDVHEQITLQTSISIQNVGHSVASVVRRK